MSRAEELKAVFDAERNGCPFLVYRDGDDRQRLVPLDGRADRLTIGRRKENDVVLSWDTESSRVHAELAHVGGEWTISDEGLSANGTWLGSDRVTGRRRLRDGDVVRVGKTLLQFRQPADVDCSATEGATTIAAAGTTTAPELTPAQTRVLAALCRPLVESPGFATPASNQAIADDLVVSVESVRTHLRALFQSFGLEDLPQNQKRAALADRALRLGLVRA
jgi:hypothetical protein